MTQNDHLFALVQDLLDDIEKTQILIDEARLAYRSDVAFQMQLEMLEHRLDGNRDAVAKISKFATIAS